MNRNCRSGFTPRFSGRPSRHKAAPTGNKPTAAFTLVELLIGMTLSLMVMTAVLSSYVFLGRSFTRSLGISSASQPNLEAQGRRALAYFTQDVRMASGIDITGVSPKVLPSATGVTLILPTSLGATTVTYSYDTSNPNNKKLIRTPAGGAAQILHANLQSFYLRYYDTSGRPYDNSAAPYTTYTDYWSGIKQLSMTFTSQGGSSVNATLTQIYRSDSSRLIIRNKQLPP